MFSPPNNNKKHRHGRNSEEGKGAFQKDFTKGNLNLNLKNEIGLGVLERIKRVFFFFPRITLRFDPLVRKIPWRRK